MLAGHPVHHGVGMRVPPSATPFERLILAGFIFSRRHVANRFEQTPRVELVNMSLRALLVRVFQIDQPSLLVTPDWLNDVRVDIHI